MLTAAIAYAMPKRIVRVNERGLRVGEDHPNAKLTDHEVDMLLQLRADGYGWKRLAKTFEISKAQVRRICAGKSRHHVATEFRRVPMPAPPGTIL